MDSSHYESSPGSLQGTGEEKIAAEESIESLFAVKFPLRILIAEHNYISRRTLVLMLERLGYQIDSVENGREALNAATKNSYELIFLDVDMPIMDGVECAHCLRDAKINTSLVAVTSVSNDLARMQCLGAGMNGYLQKPIKTEDLKQSLRMTYLSRAFSNV